MTWYKNYNLSHIPFFGTQIQHDRLMRWLTLNFKDNLPLIPPRFPYNYGLHTTNDLWNWIMAGIWSAFQLKNNNNIKIKVNTTSNDGMVTGHTKIVRQKKLSRVVVTAHNHCLVFDHH